MDTLDDVALGSGRRDPDPPYHVSQISAILRVRRGTASLTYRITEVVRHGPIVLNTDIAECQHVPSKWSQYKRGEYRELPVEGFFENKES